MWFFYKIPAIRAIFCSLKFGGSWQGTTAQRFLRQRDSDLSVDVFVGRICFWVSFRKRWRRKRERVRGECSVDAPGSSCGSWYAEPGSRGFGVRRIPSSPASLFNYLKSKTVSLRVCESPVSLQPPGALTSCKASPVCPPASSWLPPWVPFFLEALCGRGFGQEFEVPASAVSLLFLSGLRWQTCLIFYFFFLMSLKICLFHFTPWPCYETISLSTATDINQCRTGLS